MKTKIFSSAESVPAGARMVDAYSSALEELFTVANPGYKKSHPEYKAKLAEFLSSPQPEPIWVYYENDSVAVKTVPEDVFLMLRTARNRNIISEAEQQAYRNAHVGIAGLSVGSAVLNSLVISGGPKRIKIADYDVVEITNLNRIRARLTDVGTNKTHVAAREALYLDPFAELDLHDAGLNQDNISKFLSEPKLDIFVDEMDSIDLKILSRIISKGKGIPVLMATDNGDSVILDVERFDLEPGREIFHGLIGHMEPADVKNLDFAKWLQLATKIVGPEYLTESMRESLLQIGKSIASVPQLGTTASLAGAAIAFAVRRIANSQEMPSGRYAFGLEQALLPSYSSEDSVKAREASLEKFKASFGKK